LASAAGSGRRGVRGKRPPRACTWNPSGSGKATAAPGEQQPNRVKSSQQIENRGQQRDGSPSDGFGAQQKVNCVSQQTHPFFESLHANSSDSQHPFVPQHGQLL
jgi:hypothetical protein